MIKAVTHTPMAKKKASKPAPKKRVNKYTLGEVKRALETLRRSFAETEARVALLGTVAGDDDEIELDGEQNPVIRSAVILSRLSGNLRRAYEKLLEDK